MDELSEMPMVVFRACQERNWALVAASLVIGLVWLLRRYGGEWWPFLRTAKGGAYLSLTVAWVGGISQALIAGEPIGPGLFVSALGVAATASGGWTLGKKLMESEPPVPKVVAAPAPKPKGKP